MSQGTERAVVWWISASGQEVQTLSPGGRQGQVIIVLIGQLGWSTPGKVQTTMTNIISVKHSTNRLFVLNTHYSIVMYRTSINMIPGVMRNGLFYRVLFLLNEQ